MPPYNHHPFPSKQLTRIRRSSRAALLRARRRLVPLFPPSPIEQFPIPAVSRSVVVVGRSLGRSNYLTFMAAATALLPPTYSPLPPASDRQKRVGEWAGGWVSECRAGAYRIRLRVFPDPQARLFVFLRYGLLYSAALYYSRIRIPYIIHSSPPRSHACSSSRVLPNTLSLSIQPFCLSAPLEWMDGYRGDKIQYLSECPQCRRFPPSLLGSSASLAVIQSVHSARAERSIARQVESVVRERERVWMAPQLNRESERARLLPLPPPPPPPSLLSLSLSPQL